MLCRCMSYLTSHELCSVLEALYVDVRMVSLLVHVPLRMIFVENVVFDIFFHPSLQCINNVLKSATAIAASSASVQDVVVDLVHYGRPFDADMAKPVVQKVCIVICSCLVLLTANHHGTRC